MSRMNQASLISPLKSPPPSSSDQLLYKRCAPATLQSTAQRSERNLRFVLGAPDPERFDRGMFGARNLVKKDEKRR